MAANVSEQEAVNGKVDLGVRKLRAAYVENATTIYAYLENEFDILKEYTDRLNKASKSAEKATDFKEGDVYLTYSDKDKCHARARVEQPKAGAGGSKIRVRLVDIGRSDLFDASSFQKLPEDCTESSMPVKMNRYKMADLKAKGKNEGFSAQDREYGAEWLRGLIQSHGPVIKANCHQIVTYKGGIMFEGEIGGKNINQLALMQGLAVPNPAVMGKNLQPQYMLPGYNNHPGHRNPMPLRQPMQPQWDSDYLEYGANNLRGGGRQNNHHHQQQQNRNANASVVKQEPALPVPGGYNPYKPVEPATVSNKNNKKKSNSDEVQKLKNTLQNLEQSLAKKKKEITELKAKKKADAEENNLQSLAETVARVVQLRSANASQQKQQQDQSDAKVREKVADTARMVRDVHLTLNTLDKKSSDADKACSMLTQCQEQIMSLDDAAPLEITLEGAKKAVGNYAGMYIREYNGLKNNLEEGCAVLEEVLNNDVPGPRVKLNVAKLDAVKRKEIVENASQMAEKWASEDSTLSSQKISDESLGNLLKGKNNNHNLKFF